MKIKNFGDAVNKKTVKDVILIYLKRKILFLTVSRVYIKYIVIEPIVSENIFSYEIVVKLFN